MREVGEKDWSIDVLVEKDITKEKSDSTGFENGLSYFEFKSLGEFIDFADVYETKRAVQYRGETDVRRRMFTTACVYSMAGAIMTAISYKFVVAIPIYLAMGLVIEYRSAKKRRKSEEYAKQKFPEFQERAIVGKAVVEKALVEYEDKSERFNKIPELQTT